MSAPAFPPVAELVPHAEGMLLLDRVLAHEATHTVCATSADRSPLFANADGSVPSWVGIEYMAQCAAVHGELAHRRRGDAPRAVAGVAPNRDPPECLLGGGSARSDGATSHG